MARDERFTVEQVKAALEASAGIFTGAAAKLQCAPNTIKNYVERHPELKEALAEIDDMNLDLAETQLLRGIREGDSWAVIFYLKTKGKRRGYVERYEHTGKNGTALFNRDETLQRIHDKLARVAAGRRAEGGTPTAH